jgi:hypothetical protein
VYKKEKHCDANNPADARRGDNWDHVALDAEHKLVLEVVNGKRTEKNTKELVRKTAKRLKHRVPRLITSDEYKPYKKAILEEFGEQQVPEPTGERGRPKKPSYRPKPNLVYATVHKSRVKGRVNNIDYRTVFGTEEKVQLALKQSRCSRKVRKSYCFSKDWDVHRAATCLTMYSYNFCWAVRTLRRPDGKKGQCSPAMAAGLTDHLWTMKEWLTFPARQ